MRGWDNRGKERTTKGLITCKQADGSVPLPGWPLHLITAGYFVLLNSSRSLRRTARRLWAGEQEEIWGTDMRETKGLGTREWKALWRTLLSSSPEKPERAVCAACECIICCLCYPAWMWDHHTSASMLNVAWVLPGNSHSHSLHTAFPQPRSENGSKEQLLRATSMVTGIPWVLQVHHIQPPITVTSLVILCQGCTTLPKALFLVCCYIPSYFLKYLSLTTAATF